MNFGRRSLRDREGEDAPVVYAGAGCGFGRGVLGRAAWRSSSARPAPDAGGGGGRSSPVATAGRSRPAAGGKPTTCAISCAGLCAETLADDDAVLVFDETGFLKQGEASCGVARQYTGSAGRVRELSGRASSPLCALASTAMPSSTVPFMCRRSGADDAARMKAAHVPEKKRPLQPSLPWRSGMIERAIATAVPFAFVAADSVYGVADSRRGTISRLARAMFLASLPITASTPGQGPTIAGTGGTRRARLGAF